MYLTKDTITLLGNSTTLSASQYSKRFNGLVHSIRYIPTMDVNTILSTTSPLTLNIESATDNHIWNKTIDSTDRWTYYPRRETVTSAGVGMGATTDYPVTQVPLVDERIRIQIGLSTAITLTGKLEIYVEGGA